MRQAAEAWRQNRLEIAAQHWVQTAALQLPAAANHGCGTYQGEPDAHGVRSTQQLDTRSVNTTYWSASTDGVVLLEPFGGLCAGLEMALRSGTCIKQYLYVDNNPTARAIAAHRVQQLQATYPAFLPHTAVKSTFALPQDICDVFR
jgi:hypothetical protein